MRCFPMKFIFVFMILSRFWLLVSLLSCVLFVGCATNKQNQMEFMSEDRLYQKARSYMADHKFTQAIEAYQMLENRFPFGQYAENAQLELILAQYKASEYEAAIVSADRFIRLHVNHPESDYAYYYRGLAAFDANRSIFDRFFNLDMSERDPSAAKESFNNFAELLNKYPDSRFAADARGRMIYLRNILARHEVHIADFYLRRGAYTAAVNRGSYVVEHFQRSTAVGDALAVMIQGYQMMGMDRLANDTLRVLKQNYPEHLALKKDGSFNPKYTLQASEIKAAAEGTNGLRSPVKSR